MLALPVLQVSVGSPCPMNRTYGPNSRSGADGLPQVNDPHPDGLEHRLGAIPRIELLVDGRQVVFHGLLADVEPSCDLRSGAAVRDQLQHLFFALGDETVLLPSRRRVDLV